MKRLIYFIAILMMFYSCTDDPGYYPEIGLNFMMESWTQNTTGGDWTNVSVNYTVYNIGGVDLNDIRVNFEITFTNSSETNVWGQYTDLLSEEHITLQDNFYFGNIGIDEIVIIGVGMDDPADDDDTDE